MGAAEERAGLALALPLGKKLYGWPLFTLGGAFLSMWDFLLYVGGLSFPYGGGGAFTLLMFFFRFLPPPPSAKISAAAHATIVENGRLYPNYSVEIATQNTIFEALFSEYDSTCIAVC